MKCAGKETKCNASSYQCVLNKHNHCGIVMIARAVTDQTMEGPMEREAGALGGLFQQIIQDMKNGMPLWEDLITKAMKLHSSLKATILAVTAYLEAFQKIADAATNARGATREIGTALTRICLRHKAVETRMKTFTSTIMEYLVQPLQEKLEDWRKTVINLDKDHARDYKRARAELKKRSTDTLRLQKKMRKGVIGGTGVSGGSIGTGVVGSSGDLQKRLEYGLADVTERRQLMEETEKQAVRAALVEERGRFCTFVGFLKPVVDEEVAMLSELSRLQEVITQLEHHTADPHTLPPASEQVLSDFKSCDILGGLGGGGGGAGGNWGFHHTPPSSPGGSLGSRKSSVCSISSLNSSSSGSGKSPSHVHWQRSLSQPVGRSGTVRLATTSVTSVSSRDSGFTSQDSLYPRPPSSFGTPQVSNMSEGNSSNSSTPCTPFPPGGSVVPITTSTWPNLQESIQFERAASAIINDRPHTISSAYEKGVHHQRPALTVYTFQSPSTDSTIDDILSMDGGDNCTTPTDAIVSTPVANDFTMPPPPGSPRGTRSSSNHLAKPPLPTRCSSLERPSVPAKSLSGIGGVRVLPAGAVPLLEQKAAAVVASNAGATASVAEYKVAKPMALPPHIAKAMPQPTYVNMHELASMAASKAHEMSLPPQTINCSNSAATATPIVAAATVGTSISSSTVATPPDPATESSNSESSLESSSGYGSQTTLPIPPVDTVVLEANGGSVQQLEDIEAVKYCTLPRPGTTFSTNVDRRRPLSTTAIYSGGTLRPLLRRSSIQSNKPPPPIRRTASITNTNRPLTPVEHLPPPPAFLLEPNNTSAPIMQQNSSSPTTGAGGGVPSTPKPTTGVNVAETIKALTEQRHMPASPNAMRRTASQSIYQSTGLQQHFQQHLHFQQQHHMSSGNLSMSGSTSTIASPTAASILSSFSSGGSSSNLASSCSTTGAKLSYISSDSRGIIYAQPTMFTAGSSPSAVRRIHQQAAARGGLRSQSAERKTEGPGGVGSNFIAALSAKLVPNLSPRSSRRHSDDLIRSPGNALAQVGQYQPKAIVQKGPGHAFLESLNAKLTNQHNMTTPQRASKIRQIINSKTLPDPKLCHDSLMDQIKQGATLKRAKIINDRSAPKIY